MTGTHAFAIGARTWADGFGRWHAAIPADRNDGAGLILDARQCILDELVLREVKTGETEDAARARLRDYVVENVARRHQQDANLLGFVEFIEYDMDGDTDTEEPEESAPEPFTPTPTASWEISTPRVIHDEGRPLMLRMFREGTPGIVGMPLDVSLDDLRALAGLLATFDLSGSAASQHYIETGELTPAGPSDDEIIDRLGLDRESAFTPEKIADYREDSERAYSELANGRITVEEAEQRGAFAPPAPDYADEIGKQLVDRHIQELTLQYGHVRSWGTVERVAAAAARQGYALGMGAAQ